MTDPMKWTAEQLLGIACPKLLARRAPVRAVPPFNSAVWLVDLMAPGPVRTRWTGDQRDRRYLATGLLYASQPAAQKHHDMLVALSTQAIWRSES